MYKIKYHTLICIFLFLEGISHCQPLKKQQIEQLAALGKIWGFLKYFHPIVSQGKYNWDTTLVANFDKVLAAKNKTEFNDLLKRIILSAGPVTKFNGNFKPPVDSLSWNLNMKWLSDTILFKPEVSTLLRNIFNNHSPINNFYITRKDIIGNAYFPNEIQYDVVLPSKEYRFLALCRFWNVINYYYPYKYLIPGNWDSVLEEFIIRMINIQTEYAYYRTIQEMLTRVKDGHTSMTSEWGSVFSDRKLLPFLIKRIDSVFIVSKCIDTTICFNQNIRPGDTIINVDGVDALLLYKHHACYQSASNETYLDSKACLWMSIVKKKPVTICFSHQKDSLVKNVITLIPPLFIPTKNNIAYKLYNDTVGFLNLGKLSGKQVDSAFLLFQKTKYIIIDCRNYPKWTLLKLAEKVLPKQKLITQVCEPDFKNPGLITWAEPMYAGKKNPNYYKGKLILLINEETMSQAELTVLVLKNAPKCITIGTQTAGSVGDVSTLILPGRIKINYSGLGYYLPDYGLLQQKSIIPDIEVKTTRSGIVEDRDEILERAMEYIRNGR
jgi:carboxyl-terminal processing protease